jgi:hypothetical protein
MKSIVTFAFLAIAACEQRPTPPKIAEAAIFDEFQTRLVSGDFDWLSSHLDPEILKTFRRRLEFTTASPMEGSWFTGTEDRQPTTEELSSISDAKFFARYMQGFSPVLGNPIGEPYRAAKVVASTSGSKGYRHIIVTVDTEYAFPTTFSFKQDGGRWLLAPPSIVERYANKLRAARGKAPEV